MSPEQVKALIEAGIPGAEARVESGDQVHFEAEVVSDCFHDLLGWTPPSRLPILGERIVTKTYTRAE